MAAIPLRSVRGGLREKRASGGEPDTGSEDKHPEARKQKNIQVKEPPAGPFYRA